MINILNLLVILLIVLISILPSAYSRYESTLGASSKIDTAIYLLNDTYEYVDVRLPELVPQTTGYVYTFSVSNNDGTIRTDTDLEYDLTIVTTTNLPLDYEVYENGDESKSAIVSDVIEQDSDGTYFRKISMSKKSFGHKIDESNVYTLVIYYQASSVDANFQSLIESIRIEVDSRQILETD